MRNGKQSTRSSSVSSGSKLPTSLIVWCAIIPPAICNESQWVFAYTWGSTIRGAPQLRNPKTPFEIFCRRHLHDPDYPLLIRAHTEGNDLLKRKLINAMVRKGWRSYLSKVRPSNVSALFSYLAGQEGRKPRPKQFSCAGPLLDEGGTLRFTGVEKCTLLADHFERRFSSPEMLQVLTEREQYQTTRGPVPSARHNPLLGREEPKATLPTVAPAQHYR